VSGTGSSTPNSPISVPVKKLTERLPDPPAYSGKRSELRSFLNQLENKLNGNIDRYPTPDSQLRYAISRLTGDAAETVYPFQPSTVEELVTILEASYGDPNRIATAQRKLNKMTHGSKSFPSYFAEFHRYAKETGWNEPALINRLVESLNSELKASLVGVKLPDTLTACANVINGLYNDILRLAPKHTPRYSAPQPPKTRKDPDAMDIDAGTLSYAPKGSAERERRIKHGLCFKCGSDAHISSYCSVPLPKMNIRTTSTGGVPLSQLYKRTTSISNRSLPLSPAHRPRSSSDSGSASSKYHSRGRSYNRHAMRTPPRSPPKGRSRS
jgi:hypothetical protein